MVLWKLHQALNEDQMVPRVLTRPIQDLLIKILCLTVCWQHVEPVVGHIMMPRLGKTGSWSHIQTKTMSLCDVNDSL